VRKRTLGIAVVVAIAFLFIISVITRPRWRVPTKEESAVARLRTLNTAETIYKSAYPAVGFACSLSQLGPPSSGSVSSAGAGLIGSDLANGVKNGYKFTIGTCNTRNGVTLDYQWLAIPQTPPKRYFFCTDASGVIRYSKTSGNDCLTAGNPM